MRIAAIRDASRASTHQDRIVGVLILLGLALPVSTSAAVNPPVGITLSPFQQQLTIQPNDSGKGYELTLTNHTASLQELNLSGRDFGSLNDTGGVFLEGSNSYTKKYGLSSWLTLGTDTVLLQPNESQKVPVSVNNRADLQPGGHYGAVVVSVNALDPATGNKIAVNQQLLSLVFVDKVGGEKFDLKLRSIQHDGSLLHLPRSVTLHFQNPGNVHVIPRGQVKLKSPSGTVVAQGIINAESAFILPETFRDIYVDLQPIGKALPLPGLYHIQADYRYEQIARNATKSVAVNFVDLGLYLLFGAIIAITAWWFLGHKKSAKKSAPTV